MEQETIETVTRRSMEVPLRPETLMEVLAELKSATEKFDAFNSAHEGWATLFEEVDELWDEVKKSPKKRELEKMRKEAVQVAAMALRFLRDVCDDIDGPPCSECGRISSMGAPIHAIGCSVPLKEKA
jgi:phytoene dehydrogenase-like protein